MQRAIKILLERKLLLSGVLAATLFSGCAHLSPGGVLSARDRVVQLQIYLDANNFGPGVVDGSAGEFTKKALSLYRYAKNMGADQEVDVSFIVPYAQYPIVQEDLAAIGVMASEPAEIALQKSLPYTRLAELLAERFHTTEAFLHELNPGVAIDRLGAGAVVRVPNVRNPFHVADFPSKYSSPSAAIARGRWVVVDTTSRMLTVGEGSRLLAAFPITPGSAEHPAPVGEWKILRSVPWPWYRYDEGVLKRGERTEEFYLFAPGPNSPVGILWAGLNRPGIGIHGTNSPETIGRAGSHGCVRLSNWDAATFYTLTGRETRVTIR